MLTIVTKKQKYKIVENYGSVIPRESLHIIYSLLGKFFFGYFNTTKLFASTVAL